MNHSTRCTRGRREHREHAGGVEGPVRPEAARRACRRPAARRRRPAPPPAAAPARQRQGPVRAGRAGRRSRVREVTSLHSRSQVSRCGRSRPGRPRRGAVGCWANDAHSAGSLVPLATGKTYMLSGSAACTRGVSRKSTSASAPLGFRAPVQHPGVLHLAEAGVEQRPGRRRRRALGDREGRRGVVGQHDRPVALAAALGEVDLVGVLPAGGQLGAVGHQLLPVAGPGVAVPRDRREQERHARWSWSRRPGSTKRSR